MCRSNIITSPSPFGGFGGAGGASCAQTLATLASMVNKKPAIIIFCFSLLIICKLLSSAPSL
jgi:hypothetical protein